MYLFKYTNFFFPLHLVGRSLILIFNISEIEQLLCFINSKIPKSLLPISEFWFIGFLIELIEPFFPDTVVSDTLFYSHSEEIFSYCSGKRRSFNGLTNPPYLQYPLTVGSTWTTDDSLFAFDYEVIGEETILIELKDGTSVNMNCFIITMNSVVSVYYYLSSIGLVKSSVTSEPMPITDAQYPDGTGETFTISSECTLIDYYLP